MPAAVDVNRRPRSLFPLVDPLAGYSIFSLFPGTFPDSSAVDGDDVEGIHSQLKASELRNPEMLLDQAKRVIDSVTGSMGIRTTDGDDVLSKIYDDKNDVVAAEGAENPRQRRPGLGRKRAQFSLLSNASERADNIKPSENIDISEDPEEYFARLDKLEKAEKELRRQRGQALMDLDQNAPLVNARRRRPSLLGRTVTYKHRYPTGYVDNENSALPSQETLVQDVSKPSSDIIALENADQDNPSQAGGDYSAATVEDQVSKVLDELLSRNEDELQEDNILNLVQERFNMKPVNLNKINLPDLHDVRESLPESSGNASQMMLQAQSYKHEMVIACKSIDRVPEIERAFSRASPTAAKSPLNSISSLKRRHSKLDPRKDSLSAFDIDPSLVRSSSPGQIDKHPYQIDMDDGVGNPEAREHVGILVGSEESYDIHMKDVPSSHDIHMRDVHDVMCNTSDGNDAMDAQRDMSDCAINSSFAIDGEVYVFIDQSSKSEHQIHAASKTKSKRGRTKGASPGHSSKIGHRKTETEAGQREKQTIKQHADGQSLNAVEHTTEEPPRLQQGTDHQHSSDILNEAAPMQKRVSIVTAVERVQRNAACDGWCKRKQIDLRKSLAGAGSKWEAGLRRSSRIRTRPLEYWKGERLLYGRIHNTMPTVIGLKYLSPAKDGGQARVRVQSYVSNEYKDLVERAARY